MGTGWRASFVALQAQSRFNCLNDARIRLFHMGFAPARCGPFDLLLQFAFVVVD